MPDIEALRKRLQQTKNLSAIAVRCGLSLKTLYRTKSGATTPSLKTYQKIVECLDVIDRERAK